MTQLPTSIDETLDLLAASNYVADRSTFSSTNIAAISSANYTTTGTPVGPANCNPKLSTFSLPDITTVL